MSKLKYIFFYGGPFSNFEPAPFMADGLRFATSEQYFMYQKALTFSDAVSMGKILATSNPGIAKMLGRKVKGFNLAQWNKVKYGIMLDACRYKFSQNPRLRIELLKTVGSELVEASPTDKVWGIGLSEWDPRRLNQSQWRGENLLGKVLDQVRSDIIIDLEKRPMILTLLS